MTADVTADVTRFFRAVDRREWDVVRSLLADRVVLDYASVFGGEPEELTGDTVVERWRALLPGFDATQHLIGPLADLAGNGTLECNVRGYHHLDDEVWMVAGWYTLRVERHRDGHRLAGITLTGSYETGSRDLVGRAQERAAG